MLPLFVCELKEEVRVTQKGMRNEGSSAIKTVATLLLGVRHMRRLFSYENSEFYLKTTEVTTKTKAYAHIHIYMS